MQLTSPDLLRCLSSLETLHVIDCETLVLPERLGDLTSLTELKIHNCKGIKSLPESIQQLTSLQRLIIYDCPDLVQCCKSEENGMLAHMKEIVRAQPIYINYKVCLFSLATPFAILLYVGYWNLFTVTTH